MRHDIGTPQVETGGPRNPDDHEFTMHIRGELNNPYKLNARLYYPDGPSNEPITYSFDVEPHPDDPQPAST